MLNWFNRNKYPGYREKLLKAFPPALKKEVGMVLDILPFATHEIKHRDGQNYKIDNLIHDTFQTVQLEGEQLTIPYRLYFNEPDIEKEKELTDRQKTILNCIYLRHHNGYVRQSRLEKIDSNEYWVTPFTFALLGEYVIEIVDVLDRQMDDNKLENYKRFILENQKYGEQTEGRMISYWNEHYRRRFPNLQSYVGRIIFNQISYKVIGKQQDEISEIGIDEKEGLYIKPKNEQFPLIYRTATEVNWDEKGLVLYSPKPRDWSYYDWYTHIISVTDKECNCKLILTARTTWTNIDAQLKKQIIETRKTT